MNRDRLKAAVKDNRIEWQRHALERMMERGISRETAKNVLLSGELIEDYPNDEPYPSALLLGWVDKEPFHVVTAFDPVTVYCFIITVYKTDSEHFESDYKTRRQHGS